jgi:transcriptional regulator with XRE-family HTH domain
MRTPRAQAALPLPVRRALQKLGADIRDARKRRRITMALMAERALTTRKTISRLEAGDAGVSLGITGTVLFVLGMTERLQDLLDATRDPYVFDLDEEHLPDRVRTRR